MSSDRDEQKSMPESGKDVHPDGSTDHERRQGDDQGTPKNQEGENHMDFGRPNVGTASGGGGGPVGGGLGVMDFPREFLNQIGDTMQHKYEDLMSAYEKWKQS